MLCSKCHRSVKPVVAIDIDGTLGRYHEHFLGFAEGWFGFPFHGTYQGHGTFSDFMRVDKVDYRACKLAYRQGGLKRTMPVYDYAPSLIADLHLRGGAEVWLTTTRPYLRLDNIDPDTREWCRRNGIHYDGLIYGEDKYENLASIVGAERVVGVLDDLPALYDRAAELSLNPLLISREHNRADPRPDTVASLHIASRILQERSKGWSQANVGTAMPAH